MTFNPTSVGQFSAKLTLPNSFKIPLTIDFSGIAKIFTATSDKTEYSQLPGKEQEIILRLNTGNLSTEVNNLNLILEYNKKQIRFDTTFFENKIQNNWTWDKPKFNTDNVLLKGNGQLPGNFNSDIAKLKFMFLLDTGLVSKLIARIDYGCQLMTDTLAIISTTPVCLMMEEKFSSR